MFVVETVLTIFYILILSILLIIACLFLYIPFILIMDKIFIMKLKSKIEFFFFYSITEPTVYESLLERRDQMIKIRKSPPYIDEDLKEGTNQYSHLINSAILDILVFEKYEITRKYTNGTKKEYDDFEGSLDLIEDIRQNPNLLFGVVGKLRTLDMSDIQKKINSSTLKNNTDLNKRFKKLWKVESLKQIFRKK
jgi:hypothetical protein